MKRAIVTLAILAAASIMAAPSLAGHLALPHIHVTAEHLGGGLINYQVVIFNPLGGPMAVEVTAQGGFNQVPTAVDFPPFLTAPDVDTFAEAAAADAFDPAWSAANGLLNDSYWDDTDLSASGPPFGNGQGGEVGSTVFSFSAGSTVGDFFQARLGQLVVLDVAAAGLSLGPQPVVTSGLAPFSFVNDSYVAAQGQQFVINAPFAVVPEPASWMLLAIGLLGLACRASWRSLRTRGP